LRASGDGGVVGVGDGLDDGQAQAESFAAAGAVRGEALEWLEEPVHGGRRDCGACSPRRRSSPASHFHDPGA
jgi:hypothetical protein